MSNDKLIDETWYPNFNPSIHVVKEGQMVATEGGCIQLEDAVRAYRDRPSMEAELQELREKVKAQEIDGRYVCWGPDRKPYNLADTTKEQLDDIGCKAARFEALDHIEVQRLFNSIYALREQCQRYEAALWLLARFAGQYQVPMDQCRAWKEIAQEWLETDEARNALKGEGDERA